MLMTVRYMQFYIYIFISTTLQGELKKITKWAESKHIKINVDKTKEFATSFLKNDPIPNDFVAVDGRPLDLVTSFKLLGVIVPLNLRWSPHK